jgi:endonuclease/exonuclease/phosphatase family metal-dependent hydrolase
MMRYVWLPAALLLLSLGAATMPAPPTPASLRSPLRIATWNLEWLVTPETAHAARLACRSGVRSTLPCDVARRARDSADIARLAAYAGMADADVFAFQEVESAAIAGRVFNGYDICIAPGRGLQHVGFAVRRGLPHRCGPPLDSLSLGGRQRPGLTLWIAPGTSAAMEILAVHLKSGCADADVESGAASCVLLLQQARALSEWIASHSKSERFLVLGDFNRSDADTANDLFWRLLAGDDTGPPSFMHAGEGSAFRNCDRGAPYSRAIDHILVGGQLREALQQGSYLRLRYRSLDAMRYRLSDHCPVRISLISDLPATTVLH